MNRFNRYIFLLVILQSVLALQAAQPAAQRSAAPTAQKSAAGKVTEYGIRVTASYPHDSNSYTQGLFFHKGVMYESAGQYGGSNFRKVDVQSGKISRIQYFESKYFVEGSCVINDKAYILTWRERKCFVYDLHAFKPLGEARISGEGWGATTDGNSLIMTDGSDKIYYLNPDTFVTDSVKSVTYKGKPLYYLNELEYINGDIWANVYCEDYIAIIDRLTAEVKGRIDCRNLLPSSLRTRNTDVLNGIAYNPADKSVYLTGKNWPKIYKVKIYRK